MESKYEKLEKFGKEEMLKEMARRKLPYFVDYIFDGYIFGKWHKKLFNALERVERGELTRLMIFAPPRSGKTEVVSKLFPAWCLGRDPKRKIICASYGEELAKDNSRKTKQMILEERYQSVFNLELTDKKEAGNWETVGDGGYFATGVEGVLIGKGGDIIIIDDPVKSRAEVESPTVREKTWGWYTGTVLNRLQSLTSGLVVMHTRWHIDDLAGRILEEADQSGAEWEVLVFPALEESDPYEYEVQKGLILNGVKYKEGDRVNLTEKSFFPERFPTEFYLEKRRDIGVREFAAQYQQDPISSMGEIFKKSDFRYFALSDLEIGDIKKDNLEVCICVDPAFSSRQESDDLVVMALARDMETKKIYVLDIIAGAYPPSVGIKQPLNMAEKWAAYGLPIRFISIEDVSISKNQTLFVNNVDKEMRERGARFSIRRWNPVGQGKKEDRIKGALEPKFNANFIYFRVDDKGNDAWRKVEEQLLKFPPRQDDIIDCLTQGVLQFDSQAVKKKHDRNKILNRRKKKPPNPARACLK